MYGIVREPAADRLDGTLEAHPVPEAGADDTGASLHQGIDELLRGGLSAIPDGPGEVKPQCRPLKWFGEGPERGKTHGKANRLVVRCVRRRAGQVCLFSDWGVDGWAWRGRLCWRGPQGRSPVSENRARRGGKSGRL